MTSISDFSRIMVNGKELVKLMTPKGQVIWRAVIASGTVLWKGILYIDASGLSKDIALNGDSQSVINGIQLTMSDYIGQQHIFSISKKDFAGFNVSYSTGDGWAYWQGSVIGNTLTLSSNSRGISDYGTWQLVTAY